MYKWRNQSYRMIVSVMSATQRRTYTAITEYHTWLRIQESKRKIRTMGVLMRTPPQPI